MNKEEIREALNTIEVSTARGRRILDKREIDLNPSKEQIAWAAMERSNRYIDVAKHIRSILIDTHEGITNEELEAVEFVMEQIDALSKMAHETAIKNY